MSAAWRQRNHYENSVEVDPPKQNTFGLALTPKSNSRHYVPIGSKEAKSAKPDKAETIFKTYYTGVTTGQRHVGCTTSIAMHLMFVTRLVEYKHKSFVIEHGVNSSPIDDFVRLRDQMGCNSQEIPCTRNDGKRYQIDYIRNSLSSVCKEASIMSLCLSGDHVTSARLFFPNKDPKLQIELS